MVKYRLKDLFNLFAGGDIDIEHFSQYKTPIYCFPIYSNSLNNKGLYGYTSVPKYKGNSITITGRGSVGHAWMKYRVLSSSMAFSHLSVSASIVTAYTASLSLYLSFAIVLVVPPVF